MSRRRDRPRGATPPAATLLGLLVAATLAGAGCTERPAAGLQGQGTSADGPDFDAGAAPAVEDTAARRRTVIAVEVGAFADSAGAARLRDSLAAAGWEAFVRAMADGAPWRVRVAPSRERTLAEAVLAGFAALERRSQVVVDTVLQQRPTVRLHDVNGGTRGMSARLRWARGADDRALLVVEDPVSVEGDPLPDGFLLADERRGTVLQRNSVWDVAPSPDWRRVAYGHAFLVPVGGRDSVGVGQWFAVVQQTNLELRVVRRGAFPVSGMSGAMGFAQPVVEPVGPDSAGASLLHKQVRSRVPIAGGWRVRWSADGRTLAVGLPPARAVSDDAPPERWIALDAESFVSMGELQGYTAMATLRWTDGPTIDHTTPPDRASRRLPIAGGAVESGGGWVTAQGAVTRGERRLLGPGAALATTRDGRFVVALAPVGTVRPGEPRVRAVVYELVP
jgi:hypothetical protein